MSSETLPYEPSFEGSRRLLAGLGALHVRGLMVPGSGMEYIRNTSFDEADRHYDWLVGRALDMPPLSVGAAALRGGIVYRDYPAADQPAGVPLHTGNIAYIPPELSDADAAMRSAYETAGQLDDPGHAGLLLRLATYFSHRKYNGHSRGGALVESLIRDGYDASVSARQTYGMMALGGPGLYAVDNYLRMTTLKQFFAEDISLNIFQMTSLPELPAGISDFSFNVPTEDRSTDDQTRSIAAMLLAEDVFNVPLAMRVFCEWGGTGMEYIERNGAGQLVFDGPALLSVTDEEVLERLLETNRLHKQQFLECIIDTFRDYSSTYGSADNLATLVRDNTFGLKKRP